MSRPLRVLVLGGTRFIGRALAQPGPAASRSMVGVMDGEFVRSHIEMSFRSSIGFVLAVVVFALALVALCPHPGRLVAASPEPLPSTCHPTNWGEGEALDRRNRRSRHVVVPAGATEVLICRYWGYGVRKQTKKTHAQAGKLARERRSTRPSLAGSLVEEFDRSRPAHGSYACPNSDGSNLYAVFGYVNQPNAVVEVALGGCRFVRNGFGQGGFPPGRLRHRLELLTKLPRS
jgi:hypothetical protein